MFGVLFFALFIAGGIVAANRLFNKTAWYVRAWTGIVIGLICAMWLVIPPAFLLGFGITAHLVALLLMGVFVCTILFFGKPLLGGGPTGIPVRNMILMIVIPLTLLICYLAYNHTLLPKDGALYVGQSTFGDLSLHLGIATSIAEQKIFPPEYSIYQGLRLSYPFLIDSLSASLFLLGLPLRCAFLLPSFFFVLVILAGFAILAYEVLRSRLAVIVASLLFFLNGGFGILYFLDGLKQNPGNFNRIFTEFYKTPTNLVEENVRWVNVICDMIIPQRTTMAGWAIVLFAFWLLHRAKTDNNRGAYLAAGITAGLMPMIHTHSFLALGFITITWCLNDLLNEPDKRVTIRNWLSFGIPVVLLALPQLLYWTFQQSVEGSFVKLHFNWSNDRDVWLWFWVKNVGIVFLLTIPAYLTASSALRRFYSGAVTLFIVADFVVFQPNLYDNNKLFYIWYMFTTMLVASFLTNVYQKLKSMRYRELTLALVLAIGTISGILTIGREIISQYQLFGAAEVAAARFIREETPTDSLFISGDFHNNPISSLAGRNIYSGTVTYLYFHGIDQSNRTSEIQTMYTDPNQFAELASRIGVDYVYFSNYERGQFKVEDSWFKQHYPVVFNEGNVTIYAVSERAHPKK
jgi:hypothetical protein